MPRSIERALSKFLLWSQTRMSKIIVSLLLCVYQEMQQCSTHTSKSKMMGGNFNSSLYSEMMFRKMTHLVHNTFTNHAVIQREAWGENSVINSSQMQTMGFLYVLCNLAPLSSNSIIMALSSIRGVQRYFCENMLPYL